MANKCHYEMKIKGSKESVQTFIRYAEATYYIAGNKIVSDDDRYFLGMEVEEKSKREVEGMANEVVATIKGYCRWSIYSCLLQQSHHPKKSLIFMSDRDQKRIYNQVI